MAHCVNLLSPRAEFRSQAIRLIRLWAVAVGAVVIVIVPLGGWAWTLRRDAIHVHEALAARYEPIRRQAEANRRLSVEAARLVRDQQTTLELSRQRPIAALLAVVGEAVAATDGNVFVERMNFAPDGAVKPDAVDPESRLVLDVATTEGYDISQFAKALQNAPFTSAKIVTSEAVTSGEVAHNKHTIECVF